MNKLLLTLLLLSIGFHCIGQRTILMLEKKNKNKNVYYKPRDKISFRVNDSKKKFSGEIVDLKDSVIVFKGFEVSLGEISSLYIDEKTKWWLRYKVEQLSFIIGGGYLLLDLISTGEVSNDTLIISGSLISMGLLARALIGNRIKIQGRTKLRILKL